MKYTSSARRPEQHGAALRKWVQNPGSQPAVVLIGHIQNCVRREPTGSIALKSRGAERRIKGQIKQGVGQLEELIGHSADTAAAAVSGFSERALAAAGSLTVRAKGTYDKA